MGIRRPAEVLTGDMDFLTAYTLVDITDSGNTNPKGTTLTYKQAQNLNSLIQSLSMRTQLVLSSVNILLDQDLTNYSFGSDYSGLHTVWAFDFASEQPDVWRKDNDLAFFATQDVDQVPVYTELTNSLDINDYFTTYTNLKNIYII